MIVAGFFLFAIFGTIVTNASLCHDIQKRAYYYPLTTPEIAQKLGYDSEEHDITTEDGYIVTTFRIKKKGEDVPQGRSPLVFLAGFATSSDHYLLMNGRSLIFKLLDEGYDPWLGNIRGSRYGKKHKNMSATDVAFWDFSWHESGVYDSPAIIDYILKATNYTKLGFVGYSSGTTIFYVLMSKRPEYNDKIAMALIIAPVVYWYHSNNIFMNIFTAIGPYLFELALREKMIGLLALEGPLLDLMQAICTNAQLFHLFCNPGMHIVVGASNSEQNDDCMRRYMEYASSTSFKQLIHYTQVYSSGKFREYNYLTPSANLLKYGSVEPPEYDIKRARVPIAIISAHNDYFAAIEDVEVLVKETPNLLFYEKYPYQYFGHFSMALADNTTTYLFNLVKPTLQKIQFM